MEVWPGAAELVNYPMHMTICRQPLVPELAEVRIAAVTDPSPHFKRRRRFVLPAHSKIGSTRTALELPNRFCIQ